MNINYGPKKEIYSGITYSSKEGYKMTTTTTRRVWHSDGSCTDIVTRRTETQGFFGPCIHEDVQKIHHSRKELESQAEAGLAAAGIVLAGSLLYAGFKTLFGSEDKKK